MDETISCGPQAAPRRRAEQFLLGVLMPILYPAAVFAWGFDRLFAWRVEWLFAIRSAALAAIPPPAPSAGFAL
jgi:hypothetical protein